MRRLLPLLLLSSACDPTVGGTRDQNVDPTPEQLEATNKRIQAMEAERAARRAPVPVRRKINANTATKEELLASIEGLGDQMAHEIEEYRPYKSILQFRQEMGKYVNGEYIELYEKFLYVPIAYDSCDAATLMQIPGIIPDEAAVLIEGRPYGGLEPFLTKLQELTTPEQYEIGRAYVAGD